MSPLSLELNSGKHKQAHPHIFI